MSDETTLSRRLALKNISLFGLAAVLAPTMIGKAMADKGESEKSENSGGSSGGSSGGNSSGETSGDGSDDSDNETEAPETESDDNDDSATPNNSTTTKKKKKS